MAEHSLRHKTAFGMIWVGIQRFGTMTISFVANMVLARMLTPDDYGCVGMLLIFISLSTTFIDGGFGSALIQKRRPTREDYSTIFYWNLGLSVLLYLLLYAGAPLVARFYDEPVLTGLLRLQSVILIINAATMVQITQLRKQMRFKKIALINVAAAIGSVAGAIAYAYMGGGVWALVWQQILLSLITLVLLVIFAPWWPALRFSGRSFRELSGFGFFILLSSLLSAFINNFKGLLIGKVFGPVVLGYFTQAQKLEQVSSTNVSNVVQQVTYPILVEVKDDAAKFKAVIGQFNAALMALVMPLMLTLFILSEEVIGLLLGNQWIPAAPMLRILCIQGIFLCLQDTNFNAVASLGKSRELFRWSVVKSATCLFLYVAFLYLWGLYGLLWGLVGASAANVLYNSYLVARYTGYPVGRQFAGLLPVGFFMGLPFVLALLILHLLPDTVVSHVAVGAAYLGVCVMAFMWCRMAVFGEIRGNLRRALLKKR